MVLADTRRLADCFPSIDYFERRGTPFVVAVNCFEGAQPLRAGRGAARRWTSTRACRWCSATPGERESSKEVLITLLEHAMKTREARRRAGD